MRLLLFATSLLLFACSTSHRISRFAQQQVLNDSALLTAHVGISVYDPAASKYLFNHQGDKYFVPASNVKLPTCYAAMKYLGDSLVGLRVLGTKHHTLLIPTGDPTFLHEDFISHPVYEFIRSLRNSSKQIWLGGSFNRETALGSGWAWGDYGAGYMAERSAFPIYGNVVTTSGNASSMKIIPTFFSKSFNPIRSVPNGYLSDVNRLQSENVFSPVAYGKSNAVIKTPYITSLSLSHKLLLDTLHNEIKIVAPGSPPPVLFDETYSIEQIIHSQPTDSLLRPMMHRSDNFFAEQGLLMVSNERLGYMSDAAIIDTLLKTDLKDLPQKPRWADGSGLSRYNLFTPQDFIAILQKMKTEFGMARIKDILPTGGEGTLSNYYVSDSSFIYAKTGTLSGVVALSGFLYTQKGKELIFSVLVNNHQSSATAVRRAVERFVKRLRKEL